MTERSEQPQTLTVRVCDRGTGREYVGVVIRQVTIAARCPRCGGPRGVDREGQSTVRNHNFHEDGEWLSVDRWSSPCGHVDMYAAVMAEVRVAETGTTCAACRRPFDPADTRWDGAARYGDTAFCRACVDRCHDSEIADHRCPVCRAGGAR